MEGVDKTTELWHPPPFSVLKQVVIGRTIAQENVLIHKLLS